MIWLDKGALTGSFRVGEGVGDVEGDFLAKVALLEATTADGVGDSLDLGELRLTECLLERGLLLGLEFADGVGDVHESGTANERRF